MADCRVRYTGPHVSNGEPVPPRALAEFWLCHAAHALAQARSAVARARATRIPEVAGWLDANPIADCSEATEQRFFAFARTIAEEGWAP